MTITLQALSLVEKAEPVQVRFTLRLRDQQSIWMQDGCKVYVDSYMAPNGWCFMVTWTIFQNHLWEVGLTQNRKTMAFQMFNNRWFVQFYHVWEPAWIEIEITIGLGPGQIWLHTTLEDPWPHYMILEVSWDGLWTLSFRLSQFHGHNSWLVEGCLLEWRHWKCFIECNLLGIISTKTLPIFP